MFTTPAAAFILTVVVAPVVVMLFSVVMLYRLEGPYEVGYLWRRKVRSAVYSLEGTLRRITFLRSPNERLSEKCIELEERKERIVRRYFGRYNVPAATRRHRKLADY